MALGHHPGPRFTRVVDPAWICGTSEAPSVGNKALARHASTGHQKLGRAQVPGEPEWPGPRPGPGCGKRRRASCQHTCEAEARRHRSSPTLSSKVGRGPGRDRGSRRVSWTHIRAGPRCFSQTTAAGLVPPSPKARAVPAPSWPCVQICCNMKKATRPLPGPVPPLPPASAFLCQSKRNVNSHTSHAGGPAPPALLPTTPWASAHWQLLCQADSPTWNQLGPWDRSVWVISQHPPGRAGLGRGPTGEATDTSQSGTVPRFSWVSPRRGPQGTRSGKPEAVSVLSRSVPTRPRSASVLGAHLTRR